MTFSMKTATALLLAAGGASAFSRGNFHDVHSRGEYGPSNPTAAARRLASLAGIYTDVGMSNSEGSPYSNYANQGNGYDWALTQRRLDESTGGKDRPAMPLLQRRLDDTAAADLKGCSWSRALDCAEIVALCSVPCVGLDAPDCITCMGSSYDKCKSCL